MTIFLRIFLILVLCGAFLGKNVPLEAGDYFEEQMDTQGGNVPRDPSSHDQDGGLTEMKGLEGFKQKMISAAREHDELLAENRKLKTLIVDLQLEGDREGQELGILHGQEEGKKMGSTVSHRELSETSLLWDGNQNDLIQEAQDLYLSGLSADLGDAQRLRELFLYDLQYQKQELDLDVQLKEFWHKNGEDERYRKLDGQDQKIINMREREQALLQKIAEMERAAGEYPGEIERLKMENKRLRKKIGRLR